MPIKVVAKKLLGHKWGIDLYLKGILRALKLELAEVLLSFPPLPMGLEGMLSEMVVGKLEQEEKLALPMPLLAASFSPVAGLDASGTSYGSTTAD